MRPILNLIVMAAALALVAPNAVAQAKEEPSGPEQLIEGVRGFFRNLFGGGDETPAAKAPAPAASRPEPVAEAVRASPVAQVDPASLHAAAAKGDFDTVSKLVAQGSDIEAKDPATGGSVLHYAVMRGNPETIDLLLARGADVNSRTKNGTTPLHTAVLYNRYEVMEKLLAKGADINAQSASGATPLALASAARNRTIAELLRSRGAK